MSPLGLICSIKSFVFVIVRRRIRSCHSKFLSFFLQRSKSRHCFLVKGSRKLQRNSCKIFFYRTMKNTRTFFDVNKNYVTRQLIKVTRKICRQWFKFDGNEIIFYPIPFFHKYKYIYISISIYLFGDFRPLASKFLPVSGIIEIFLTLRDS